jgi:hypothetical protein
LGYRVVVPDQRVITWAVSPRPSEVTQSKN